MRLLVLVGEDLLATLAAGHAVLLLLAHLGGGELGLLLLAVKSQFLLQIDRDDGRMLPHVEK